MLHDLRASLEVPQNTLSSYQSANVLKDFNTRYQQRINMELQMAIPEANFVQYLVQNGIDTDGQDKGWRSTFFRYNRSNKFRFKSINYISDLTGNQWNFTWF